MSPDTIISIISSIGFPITCCLILFWYINKKDDKHSEEMNSVKEALNNNTLVLQKLIDKLSDNEDKKKEGLKNYGKF